MISKIYDKSLLKRLLKKGTPLIYISIVFDGKGNVGIKESDGVVCYISSYRNSLIWKDNNNTDRTLNVASFGQLVPGYYPGVITFYGLFFAENYSLDSLLESAKKLYENMLNYKLELENTICKISKLIKENEVQEAQEVYIVEKKEKVTYYKKYKRKSKYK